MSVTLDSVENMSSEGEENDINKSEPIRDDKSEEAKYKESSDKGEGETEESALRTERREEANQEVEDEEDGNKMEGEERRESNKRKAAEDNCAEGSPIKKKWKKKKKKKKNKKKKRKNAVDTEEGGAGRRTDQGNSHPGPGEQARGEPSNTGEVNAEGEERKADSGALNTAGVTPLVLARETSNQGIRDIFDTNFNKPDTAPQEEIYPNCANNAVVVDTIDAKDKDHVEQVPDALADVEDTYEVCGAKHSIHGTVYQLCLLMVFALRAFFLGYTFWLGTEVREAEQFDDIVFKYQIPKSDKIKNLLVQVKLKANAGKGITSYDLLANGSAAQFSLLKYFKSFVKIMQAKGQEASGIDFAICTNTHFELDELCKIVGDKIALSMEIVTDVYQGFFEEGKCYKLVADNGTVALLIDDFVAKLSNESNKDTKELHDILFYLNDGISLKTFMNNLIFVVEQPADNELVKTEFRAHSYTKLLGNDLSTDEFYKQVYDWFSNKTGVWLKNKTLKEMIDSVKQSDNTFKSSGVTRVYAENLLTLPLKFKEDKLDKLNDLMTKYTIVNVATTMESKLTLIQVAQALKHSSSYAALDSYMFMRESSLVSCGTEELALDAFKSPGTHNLLIIDCVSKTEEAIEGQLTTLGDSLLEIITNNPKKKLVIIAPENHELAEMFSSSSECYKHTVTHTWKDLTKETQDNLLATSVFSHGKCVKFLNQLIDKTETQLLELVPLETLIEYEGLIIGTEMPTHISYNESFYIDRSVNSVNQIVLKAHIFEDKSKMRFKEGFTLTETDFQKLCQTNPRANIHLINKQGDRYIWVKTHGKFKSLRPYIDYTICQSFSEEEFLNFSKLQRVVIFSDLASMGKSTVLTHLSYIIKATFEGTLVFTINLNHYTEPFTEQNKQSTLFDHSSAFEFLCNEIIMMKTPLEKALLKREGKVVLLFDGFDEISPDYEETVLGLIQCIIEATEAQIWITTRPFMKEKLEDTFQQWSSSLEPFSEQNKVDFVTKHLKHKKTIQASDVGGIKEIASSLVSQFSKSISDKEREFTGIPLEIKMLTECFVDDFKKLPDLGKYFNLVDLYKKSIDKKFEIFYQKIAIHDGRFGARYMKKIFLDSCIVQHRCLALSVILSEVTCASLLPDCKNVIDSNETITVINQIGIVNLINSTPHFIHRAFAEYLVAEYFLEILKHPQCMSPNVKSFILSELLIKDNYLVIRAFLNGLLAKCQPTTDTLSTFQNSLFTEDDINSRYRKMKDNFLITAIEGNEQICIYLLNGVKGKDEVVLKLLQGEAPNEKLLNLAAANNNAKYIKSLLQWTLDNTNQAQRIPDLVLLAVDSNDNTALEVASKNGHKDVVLSILDWTRDNVGTGPMKKTMRVRHRDRKQWRLVRL